MAASRIAYLLAGTVIGAAGMALIKEGKGEKLLQAAIVGGHGLTDKLLCTVETVKEDIEDYIADAKYRHQERAAQAAAAAAGTADAGNAGNAAEAADATGGDDAMPAEKDAAPAEGTKA